METQNVGIRDTSTQSGQTADSILREALKGRGLRYVGIKGNTKGGVAVYGEAPGRDEDLYGFPFVGYSGKLLDEMIKEAGFNGSEMYFSNPYKTRPPENDIKRIDELGIPKSLFINQFYDELRTYKPTIIISCGRTPTNLLCPFTQPKSFKKKTKEDKEGFGSWRGSLLESPLLNWPHYVIPMYHPAFVLRNYAEREICVLILQKALEEHIFIQTHSTIQPLPSRNLLVNPDFDVAYNYLNGCLLQHEPISVDIELLRRKVPYTISFAKSPTDAISISLWSYSETQLVYLWRQMNEIFKTKRILGQNFTSFDSHWLRCLGFNIDISKVDDTLLLHHCLWPSLRHRLEFLCMQYTREPFYKDEGKGWNPRSKSDVERLMKYNAKDAAVTYEVWLAQKEELKDREHAR